jgi:HK97 family phage major capsid protein
MPQDRLPHADMGFRIHTLENTMKLHELKRARAQLAAKTVELRVDLREARKAYRELLEKADPGEDLPPEAKPVEQRVTECESMLDEHQKSLDAHDGRIGELERAMEDDAATAAPPDDGKSMRPGPGHNGGPSMSPHGYGEPPRPREGKGFKAARFAVGVLQAKSNGLVWASEWIERAFGDKEVAKALNTTGVASGGALIPQYFSSEIIELLRAATIVRACDPMIVDMSGGNLTIPRLAGGATAGYQGELDDISASQETFDDIQLNAKKLTALVPVSNDLIRRAPQNIEMIVRDDMVQTMARREDLAFLLGNGAGNSPIGIYNQCAASQSLIVAPFTAADNATILTAVVGTLNGMELTLRNNFSRMIRPRWNMSPVTEFFLKGLRDQVGNFVFKDEMEKGTLNGIMYKTTQQFPTNLTANLYPTGTAADGAYLFLVDYADIIIAETYRMMVDASDVAAYKDSSGTMVSAWTRDQTSFRLIEEHDFAVRHQASICVALLPGWAPPGFAGFTGGAPYYVQALNTDQSAAPSTWGYAPPTGSNNPGNSSANAPGGTQPGRA